MGGVSGRDNTTRGNPTVGGPLVGFLFENPHFPRGYRVGSTSNFGRLQRTLTSKNDYRGVEKIRDGQNAWYRQNSGTVDKILGHLFQVFFT